VIDQDTAAKTIHEAMSSGADFAEIFAEERRSHTTGLDDGRVEEFVTGRSRGAGIRVCVGDTIGFAHTADISRAGLLHAARQAAAAVRSQGEGVVVAQLERVSPIEHEIEIPLSTVTKEQRVEKLRIAEDAARSAAHEIKQVSAGYGDSIRKIFVANSDGVLAEDEISRVRFSVSVVADGDAGMQTGFYGPGYTGGWEYWEETDPAAVAKEAARQALVLLDARPAPAGAYPVVLRKGGGGVLFHEACGHGLEADHVLKNTSIFADKIGQKVAADGVTLVDDGSFDRGWGTAGVDDEGVPVRRNVLIQDGVLSDYMWDGVRARKTGRPLSGNGRRQNYRCLPMVRMTNTLLLPGEEDPDEIIRQTPHGVYVASLSGGQVDTSTGDFVFGMSEAYMIENGEITYPLRGANLIGNGPEVLQRIDAIANDFDVWPGTCGKDGQSVSVTSGQPTLRVSSITIGGTA